MFRTVYGRNAAVDNGIFHRLLCRPRPYWNPSSSHSTQDRDSIFDVPVFIEASKKKKSKTKQYKNQYIVVSRSWRPYDALYVTQQLLPNLVDFWQHSVLPAFVERDRIGPDGVYVGWIPPESGGRKRTADAAGLLSEMPPAKATAITPVTVQTDGCC